MTKCILCGKEGIKEKYPYRGGFRCTDCTTKKQSRKELFEHYAQVAQKRLEEIKALGTEVFKDCKTRKEAEELREKAVRNGFRDAWVVPSKIVVKNKGQSIR